MKPAAKVAQGFWYGVTETPSPSTRDRITKHILLPSRKMTMRLMTLLHARIGVTFLGNGTLSRSRLSLGAVLAPAPSGWFRSGSSAIGQPIVLIAGCLLRGSRSESLH